MMAENEPTRSEHDAPVSSWEAPAWLVQEVPAVAELCSNSVLPARATTALRRIVCDRSMRWVRGEIARTTRPKTQGTARFHELTAHNRELLQRIHNRVPAGAMDILERAGGIPEDELRWGLFSMLVIVAALMAVQPTKTDVAPELQHMLAAMENAEVAARNLEAAGSCDAARKVRAEVHQSYGELKERLPPLNPAHFANPKEREEALVVLLATLTMGNLSGHVLHQSIANIVTAALGSPTSKSKVVSIVKRKIIEFKRKNPEAAQARAAALWEGIEQVIAGNA